MSDRFVFSKVAVGKITDRRCDRQSVAKNERCLARVLIKPEAQKPPIPRFILICCVVPAKRCHSVLEGGVRRNRRRQKIISNPRYEPGVDVPRPKALVC